MARHRPTLALSQEVDFPRETKSVEFLKIGSLDQMLWLRDAEWVYRVHCDIAVGALAFLGVNLVVPWLWLFAGVVEFLL